MLDFTKEFVNDLERISQNNMDRLIDSIIELSGEDQSAFFMNFTLFIDGIAPNTRKILAKLFLKKYSKFKNIDSFFVLDNEERLSLAFSELLNEMDFDDVKEVLNEYISKSDYLTFFIDTVKYLERNHSDIQENKIKIDYMKKSTRALAYQIIDNPEKKLYSKGNYKRKYIIFLHYVFKEIDDESKVKNYIQNNLNKENVYRILNDLISYSEYSSGNRYYSLLDGFENLVDENLLKKLLESTSPMNNNQKFIKKVFDNHYSGEKNKYGDKGIFVDKEMDLERID